MAKKVWPSIIHGAFKRGWGQWPPLYISFINHYTKYMPPLNLSTLSFIGAFLGTLVWIIHRFEFFDYPIPEHPWLMFGTFIFLLLQQTQKKRPPFVTSLLLFIFLSIFSVMENDLGYFLALTFGFGINIYFIRPHPIPRYINTIGLIASLAQAFLFFPFISHHLLFRIIPLYLMIILSSEMGKSRDKKPSWPWYTLPLASLVSDVEWTWLAPTLILINTCFLLMNHWEPLHFPNSNQNQQRTLWITHWIISLGLVIQIFDNSIDSFHLIYVGGIGVLALIYLTDYQVKRLGLILFFILFTALTRYSAAFMDDSYDNHILYSAFIWNAAILYYGYQRFRCERKQLSAR